MTKLYLQVKPESDDSEKYIIGDLTNKGNKVIFQADSDVNFPWYDLIVLGHEGKLHTIECKLDRRESNYIAIEFEQSGKPSALQISTADFYFVHKFVKGKIYWIRTDELKDIISMHNPFQMSCNKGATKCYLIPTEAFNDNEWTM